MAYVAADKARIDELKSSVDETEINLREKIYSEIDKIEKEIVEKYEKVFSYIYAAIGTLVVSFVSSHVLAKKVKKIDMVTSLKGNE